MAVPLHYSCEGPDHNPRPLLFYGEVPWTPSIRDWHSSVIGGTHRGNSQRQEVGNQVHAPPNRHHSSPLPASPAGADAVPPHDPPEPAIPPPTLPTNDLTLYTLLFTHGLMAKLLAPQLLEQKMRSHLHIAPLLRLVPRAVCGLPNPTSTTFPVVLHVLEVTTAKTTEDLHCLHSPSTAACIELHYPTALNISYMLSKNLMGMSWL